MSDGSEDSAKKIILARRARFVAAAMAGASIACGKTTSPDAVALPTLCLSVIAVRDAEPEVGDTPDATVDTVDDASASTRTPGAPDAGRPVIDAGQPVPKPKLGPMPCLTPAMPKKQR